MAAAAAAAAAAIAAKPAGQININLGGGGAGGGSGPARANGSQGAASTQSSAVTQRSVYDFDIEGVEDKPWTKPGASYSAALGSLVVVLYFPALDEPDATGWQITGADPSDWFNYGFNEEAWKAYCQKQKTLREEYQLQSKIKVWMHTSSSLRQRICSLLQHRVHLRCTKQGPTNAEGGLEIQVVEVESR
jgi:hypothetical protein